MSINLFGLKLVNQGSENLVKYFRDLIVSQRFLGENETPQEHPLSAIGLSVTSNADLIISYTYSIVDPFIISRVNSSLRTRTPFLSIIRMSSISA